MRVRGVECGFALGSALLFASSAAAQAPANPTALENIVVTAERTNRTLADSASSIAVMTGRDVDRAPGVQTTYDVLGEIPNLVATRSSNNAPAVRGIDGGGPAIGANAFFAGTRPRLNFQVDGRTLTFNEAVYLDGGIWDLQQAEVYRGPQSTLQGRNSIGGVVALKTADPTFTWSGKARALIGGYDTRQLSAAVGGPLVADNLAFRLSADYREEQAPVDIPSYKELADPGQFEALTLRGKLLLTPASASSLRSLLTVSYTTAFAPQTLSVRRPFHDYVYGPFVAPRFRTNAFAAISDTSWQVAERFGLSSFMTATNFDVHRSANAGNGIAQINGTEYTFEPRARFGASGDALTGFVAAYLFRSKQNESIDLFNGGTFLDRTLTQALFGEATYKVAPIVDVTLGARYEEEHRYRVGGAGAFVIDYDQTFKAFLPRGTVTVRPRQGLAFGATIGKGYNAGGAGFAFNPPFPSYVYDKEEVWNYEAFLRSTLMDGALDLNGNVFFNDYSALQLPFDVAQNPSAPALVIRNAEKATTYGAELQARYRVSAALDLNGAVGLLGSKVDRYNDPLVEGRKLPRAPAFTMTVGAVAHPVKAMDASLSVRYTDAYYSDAFNQARGRTKAYAIANAQVGYSIRQVRVFAAVTNLFDEQTPVFINPVANAASDTAIMTQPRRLTAGVELAF